MKWPQVAQLLVLQEQSYGNLRIQISVTTVSTLSVLGQPPYTPTHLALCLKITVKITEDYKQGLSFTVTNIHEFVLHAQPFS